MLRGITHRFATEAMLELLASALRSFVDWVVPPVVALVRWVVGGLRAVWNWILARLGAWLGIVLVSLRSFFLRLRMSHDNGIAARGSVRFVKDAQYPENDFFKPGREFPCRCRFAESRHRLRTDQMMIWSS